MSPPTTDFRLEQEPTTAAAAATNSTTTTTTMEIGSAVVDARGFRGIIRYIGTLPFVKPKLRDTLFAGVEWLDEDRSTDPKKPLNPSKSSNDQNQENPHHFDPQFGRSATYVKLAKLKTGVSFGKAVKLRYEPEAIGKGDGNVDGNGDNEGGDDTGPVYMHSGRVVEIEQIGMDKIRSKQRLAALREVVVERCDIVHAESEMELVRDAFGGHVKELGLASNLIHAWDTVAKITEPFTALEHLNLSHNPLRPLPGCVRLSSTVLSALKLSCLKVLVLNNTQTTIAQIQRLDNAGAFPLLEDLCLAHNFLDNLDPISDLTDQAVKHEKGSYAEWAQQSLQLEQQNYKSFTANSFLSGFVNLRSLDISGNKIKRFSEVWRLSRLPKLERLSLAENPLEDIFFDPVPQAFQVEEAKETEAQEERKKAAEMFAAKHVHADDGGSNVDSAEGPATIDTEARQGDNSGNAHEDKEAANAEPVQAILMSNGVIVPIPATRNRNTIITDARRFKRQENWSPPFDSLRAMNLNLTAVGAVEKLNVLDQFPVLEDLRLSKSTSDELPSAVALRPRLIASIRKLKLLNGSVVRPRERSDAEKLYLRNALASCKTRDLVSEENFPRFAELCDVYGDPFKVDATVKTSVQEKFARLTFRSFDPRTCTAKPVTHKIPLDANVASLKMLCKNWFKVDPDRQKLFYRANVKDFGHPMLLEDEDLLLGELGVQNGGEILMEATEE